MRDELKKIKEAAVEALANADTMEYLNEQKVRFLGKKGELTTILKGMGKLSDEERPLMGQLANEVRDEINKLLDTKMAELKLAAQQAKLASETIDVTLPGRALNHGTKHPVTMVIEEAKQIFMGLGFEVAEGPEIESDYYNFEALNLPKDHPARDMQDTYYLENSQLLKSHTSAAQNAIYKKYKDALVNDGMPIKAIFPGRCFRNEATDACHENTFFQMEGVMVDKDISISNLIYFMKTMLSEVFQKDIKVRLRPGFFPFVEPGFELDISCLICGGEGCPSCKHSGWLELCPCGMIHPEVLKAGEIDPEEYTGFAFGLGLTRLAMMKYGVKDIRDLNSGSLKTLSQFTDDEN